MRIAVKSRSKFGMAAVFLYRCNTDIKLSSIATHESCSLRDRLLFRLGR
jgi:hypothetical protein